MTAQKEVDMKGVIDAFMQRMSEPQEPPPPMFSLETRMQLHQQALGQLRKR